MEYHVIIPEEVFAILEWEQDGLPAVGVVNQSLARFEPKVVFAWHLSIIVDFMSVASQGMPTPAERQVIDEIGDEFDKLIKADGNALFLGRITWNRTRQFLYRVYDPEIANRYLTKLVEEKHHLREFVFRMVADESWEHAKLLLSHIE